MPGLLDLPELCLETLFSQLCLAPSEDEPAQLSPGIALIAKATLEPARRALLQSVRLTSRERTAGLVDLLRREPACGAYIRELVVDVNPGGGKLGAADPDGVGADQLSVVFASLAQLEVLALRLDASTLSALTPSGVKGLAAAEPCDVTLEGCGLMSTPDFWLLARVMSRSTKLLTLRFVRLAVEEINGDGICFGRLINLTMEGMDPAEEVAVVQSCGVIGGLSMAGGGMVLDAMPVRMRFVMVALEPGLATIDFAARHDQMLPALRKLIMPLVVEDAVFDHLPEHLCDLTLRGVRAIEQVSRRLRDRQWARALETVQVAAQPFNASKEAERYSVRVRKAAKGLQSACRARGIEFTID